uniref:Uncharacterized protein n=1 Tax=Leersia perrieri TaxID=77586 RepID=A0A0D9X654_9ORYZ
MGYPRDDGHIIRIAAGREASYRLAASPPSSREKPSCGAGAVARGLEPRADWATAGDKVRAPRVHVLLFYYLQLLKLLNPLWQGDKAALQLKTLKVFGS